MAKNHGMAVMAIFALCASMATCAWGLTRETLTLDGDHGKLSAVFEHPGDATNCPAVIVMHGYSGNKEARLLREIAEKLNAKGFATMRFDFNGHGESEGRFQDMTVPNEVADAKKVYEYLQNRPDVGDISLVGHSQGGVVASLLAGELGGGKIKAVALLAPATILKKNALEGDLFGRRYDARNPPEYVEAFGRRLGREYILSAQKLPIYETAAKFTGALLVVHGLADRIVPYSCAERYKAELPQTQLVPLEGYDHGFSQGIARVADIVAAFMASAR